MSFVLKKVSSYKWPVAVEIPVDGGKFKKETFTAIFKRISRSEFNSLFAEGEDALVDAIVVGWTGIKDEDGEDLPFDDTTKAQLFDDPFVLKGLINAYADSFQGAPVKN